MAQNTKINLSLNEIDDCLCPECKKKFAEMVGKAVLAKKGGE